MTARRDPNTIIVSHMMDPARRELYVEGPSDRLFLKWIAGCHLHRDVLIQEIGIVNIPGQSAGGERGRLMSFARLVEGSQADISFFSDADFDRLLDRLDQLPGNVWLTDGRDLESYFLREDCFEKVVKLAIGTEEYSGKDLFGSIAEIGRILGCLRVYSETNGLDLPYQETSLRRCVSFGKGRLAIDLRRYVGALLSNAQLSGSLVQSVIEGTTRLLVEYGSIPCVQIIHGKDLVTLLAEVLRNHGLHRDSAEAILRSSFERSFIGEYPSLTIVFHYVTQM